MVVTRIHPSWTLLFVFVFNAFGVVAQDKRQATDCTNPVGPSGVNPSCWETLKLTDYTRDWWAVNGTKCKTGTGFSTCFLQVYNLGLYDCTGVKPNSCPPPSATAGYSPQEWYVLYNIYAINQVFLSLYQAIGNANTLASERVGAVVALLDPPEKNNIFVHDLLTALSAGFALLPAANAIAGTIIKAAQQIPNVVGLLFPVGTTDSRVAQWANINNELATVVQYYQGNISDIIPAVNNNLDSFIAYAGTGQFSVNPLPDLSDESDALLQGLSV
ncbi:MAG: hypothetical protein Q9225_006681 [Loekoesia sp. 1 TL-2023]